MQDLTEYLQTEKWLLSVLLWKNLIKICFKITFEHTMVIKNKLGCLWRTWVGQFRLPIHKTTEKKHINVNSWSELGASTTAGFGCHSGNITQQIPKIMIDINQGWASHRNAQNPKANIKLQQ